MGTLWSLRLLCPVLWLFWSTSPVTPASQVCRRLFSQSSTFPCPPCGCFYSSDHHAVAHCSGFQEPLPDLLRSLPDSISILCLQEKTLSRLAPHTFSDAGLTGLVELSLYDSNLSDVSPNAFADLKVLETLDLSENRLTTLHGDALRGLDNLQYLKLSSNLIAALEDRVFANNPELSFLDLSNNSIGALTRELFYGLQNLVNLSLSANKISNLPNGTFANLKNLKFLDLSNNKLDTLPPEVFNGLENLVGLSLQFNQLPLKNEAYPNSVFTPLNSSLRLLLLNGNAEVHCGYNMEYPETALQQLTALESLHIDGLCNGTFGPGFGNLTSLSKLSLSGRTGHCAIGTLRDDTFRYVGGLTHLNLSLCEIRDTGEEVFSHMTSLQVLDLSCNYHLGFRNLTKAGKSLMGKSNLTTLYIDFIHGRYSVSIYVFKELTEFFKNTSLKELYASGNRIESFEHGALSNFPRTLQRIVAKYNRFTFGPYILELLNLKGLTSMDVGNGGIDTDLPDVGHPTDSSRYCLYGRMVSFPGPFHRPHGDDEASIVSPTKDGEKPEEDEVSPDESPGPPLFADGSESSVAGLRRGPHSIDHEHPPKTASLQFQVQPDSDQRQQARYAILPASDASRQSDQKVLPPRIHSRPRGFLHPRASAALSRSRHQPKEDYFMSALPSLGDECAAKSGKIVVNLPPNLTNLSMRWSHLYYHVGEVYFSDSNRLRYLDLSCNGLSVLEGPVVGLSRLRHLDLSTNFAHRIGRDFFKCLRGLTSLDLSDNSFDYRVMKTAPFRYLTELRKLDLSKNRLDGIYAEDLENLTKMEVIDVSDNKITEAFLDFDVSRFQHLDTLILRSNNLNYLSDDLRNSLDELATHKTVRLDLSLNPITCSCDRLDFLEWMNSTKVVFLNTDQNYCLFSDGSAELMKNFSSRIIQLKKQCRVNMFLFTLTLFGFIILSIVCIIGVICYRFRWKLRYLYYAYRNERRASQERRHFRYDVFLSYAEEDIEFVHGELVDRLEKQEGLRVNIHYRDFTPGRPIASNIIDALQNSRHAVFVITRDFLASYWCLYELQMAKMESLHTERDVAVMVLFENLRALKLPTEVLYYVQMDTYVEYPRDSRCRQYFWDNLVHAVK